MPDDIELLIDGHYGVYIPQYFAQTGMAEKFEIAQEDIDILI